MIFKFIIFRVRREEGDRCSHLQKAVSDKLQPLVVLTHASLYMKLLSSVLLCVVGVFGEGLKSQFWLYLET
jgi:hypothetical protein